MNLTRRGFVSFATLLTAGAVVGFGALSTRRAAAQSSFGPLLDDPDKIIDLPAGFSYKVLQSAGDVMTDGAEVRGLPDGMAVFPGELPGQLILMRNHEEVVNGGVSRLVLDAETLEVVSSNDVLGGTVRNCAGGPSPWGWLSCEEYSDGWVWVCPTDTTSILEGNARLRVDDYGKFSHEGVCIDPDTLIAYLTEDDGDSFLFRMVPSNAAQDPFKGQLQAMKVAARPSFDATAMQVGETVDVEWVDVSPATARASATAAKAATVHRGEGIWWFDGSVYFTATTNGQVFELIPNAANDGGILKLITNTLDGPDNVTVAPWGELFVAEDNGNVNHIRVVDAAGNVSDFARNAADPEGEFAGVCFSPDGKQLFVNLQTVGKTLVIQGPFQEAEPEPGVGGPGGDAGGTAGSGGASGGSKADPSDGKANGGASGGKKGTPNGGTGASSGGSNNAGASGSSTGDDGGCGVAPASKSTAQTALLAAALALGAVRRSRTP